MIELNIISISLTENQREKANENVQWIRWAMQKSNLYIDSAKYLLIYLKIWHKTKYRLANHCSEMKSHSADFFRRNNLSSKWEEEFKFFFHSVEILRNLFQCVHFVFSRMQTSLRWKIFLQAFSWFDIRTMMTATTTKCDKSTSTRYPSENLYFSLSLCPLSVVVFVSDISLT